MICWFSGAALALVLGRVLVGRVLVGRVVIGCAVFQGQVLLGRWLEERAFAEELREPLAAQARAPSPETASTTEEAPQALLRKEVNDLTHLPPVRTERRETPAFTTTQNLLLVGIDRRPGQKYGGLPDTIVVAALSEQDAHLGLISVPRDLYVEIPGHGMDRINATFTVAQSRKEPSLDLLERVVEDTLKLPISHKIALNLAGFERIIDALGGVDVDIPCPISDNFVDPRTESGRRLLKVDAGLQHLDGIGAGLYVRSRHGRSDFSRSRRQQAVLFAIKRRFETLDGIAQLPEFLEELGPLVTSDMTRADVFRLARAASSLKPENIHGLVLGAKQAAPHYTEDGKAVLLPDFDEIDRSLALLFSSELPGKQPELAPCPEADIALRRRSR